MTTNSSTIIRKLKQYSILASPIIALSTPGDAQISYHDVNPDYELGAQAGDFAEVAFDLNNDGITDFVFSVFSKYQSDSEGPKFNKAGIAPFQENGNAIIGYTHTHIPNKYYYASALNVNDDINNSKHFWDYFGDFGTFVYYQYPNHTFGQWNDITDRFMGFRLKDNAGNTHYGWMRLDVFKADARIVIKDYAYESTPDLGIKAGDGGVPVENVNPENDINIFAYNKTLFIESTMQPGAPLKISGMDLLGKKMLEKDVHETSTQISLKSFSAGIYLVSVVNGAKLTTKKISVY
jgi:hypothetical protein